MNSNHNILIPTMAGTIFSVSFIAFDDILKSALLAAVGATVSLTVSLLLRYVIKKARQKFQRHL
jgi:energy-converting hydrogenase Eha subunit E